MNSPFRTPRSALLILCHTFGAYIAFVAVMRSRRNPTAREPYTAGSVAAQVLALRLALPSLSPTARRAVGAYIRSELCALHARYNRPLLPPVNPVNHVPQPLAPCPGACHQSPNQSTP